MLSICPGTPHFSGVEMWERRRSLPRLQKRSSCRVYGVFAAQLDPRTVLTPWRTRQVAGAIMADLLDAGQNPDVAL